MNNVLSIANKYTHIVFNKCEQFKNGTKGWGSRAPWFPYIFIICI